MLRCVPLHGRPGIVSADFGKVPHHVFRMDKAGSDPLLPGIEDFHIPVLLKVCEIDIRHAQFFAVVNIRRAVHQMNQCGQHFGAADSVERSVIAVPADLARLIMVAQIHAVPGFPDQRRLPSIENLPHFLQLCLMIAPFSQCGPVIERIIVLKGEDHIQFFSIQGCIADCLFHRAAGFPDGQKIIPVQHPFPHFPDIAVRGLGMLTGGFKASVQSARSHRAVVKVFFANHADDIHPVPVNPLVTPPGHHVKDRIPDFGVGPVEIRLLGSKQVQVILVCGLIILPCTAGKTRAPVIRGIAVFPVFPYIPVPVRIVPAFAAFNEEGVLGGGVVDDKVNHHFHAPGVHFAQETVKILHGAEFRVDPPVIGDIIAVVIVRGRIERRNPDHIHAQIFQIIQVLRDPVQIPDTITVAVRKAARINLIDHRFLPPCTRFHCCPSVLLC